MKPPSSSLSFTTPPDHHNNPRPPKILLPTFDGSNPLDWIFQAKNYFSYYRIPDTYKLQLTVFHFTGEALSWYKYLANNKLLGTWPEFSRALELRFGPSDYENHKAALFKLKQTTSVVAYQAEFERLCNCITSLPTEALLNCYLSSLKPDILAELSILKPTSLHQAYGLSKRVEDKLSLAKQNTFQPHSFFSKNTTNSTPNPVTPPPSTKPNTTPHHSFLLPNQPYHLPNSPLMPYKNIVVRDCVSSARRNTFQATNVIPLNF
ncbi:putative retrotransposon gag domain-containing protein [Helianthus annuus]|nr:putative retrotransposon gag domain-containing protein [Helianthus annuus]